MASNLAFLIRFTIHLSASSGDMFSFSASMLKIVPDHETNNFGTIVIHLLQIIKPVFSYTLNSMYGLIGNAYIHFVEIKLNLLYANTLMYSAEGLEDEETGVLNKVV